MWGDLPRVLIGIHCFNKSSMSKINTCTCTMCVVLQWKLSLHSTPEMEALCTHLRNSQWQAKAHNVNRCMYMYAHSNHSS